MIITYQGGQSFKVSQGDLALLVNPTNARSKADITLFSIGRPELGEGTFTITGPGEYEVKDVVVKGFLSEGESGKINAIYLVNFEGMNLCFLGSLANPELNKETVEALEDIDILFVPLKTLDPAEANKLAVKLEPGIIIPTDYTDVSLKQFIKEGGEKSTDPIDKLVLKKKDLDGKEGEIVVLKEE